VPSGTVVDVDVDVEDDVVSVIWVPVDVTGPCSIQPVTAPPSNATATAATARRGTVIDLASRRTISAGTTDV
jgi:hypothetical protein